MKTKRYECLNVIVRYKCIYDITNSDALRIYLYIVCHVENRNYCYLSVDLLSNELNITKQRVISALDMLKHDYFIAVFGDYKHKNKSSMVYQVLDKTAKIITLIEDEFD